MRAFLLFGALLPLIGNAAKFENLGSVPSTVVAIAPAPRQAGFCYLADRSAGKFDCGQILQLHNRRTRVLYTFNGYKGKSPSVLIAVRRDVYGITTEGGKNGDGTLFRIRRGHLQTLAHFNAETGAPRNLQASGRTVYGVCANGVYRLHGQGIDFFPLSVISSAAIYRGRLYGVQNYLYRLYRLEKAGATLVKSDWPAWTVVGRRGLLGIGTYDGKYSYGGVTQLDPVTGAAKRIVEFQSYNGGRPTELVVLGSGQIYSANADGIWHVGKHPRSVKKLTSIQFLNTDGRKLYGLAGYLPKTVFSVMP